MEKTNKKDNTKKRRDQQKKRKQTKKRRAENRPVCDRIISLILFRLIVKSV